MKSACAYGVFLISGLLVALPSHLASQDRGPTGIIRTGLFVELSGGGTGVVGDLRNQSGPFLGARLGYTITSTVSVNVRFISGKTLLADVSLYPGSMYQPGVGTVAFEGLFRFLRHSSLYPVVFAGYGWSTLHEQPRPTFNGSGYHMGAGIVYHFSVFFSVGLDVFFSRTWFHVREDPMVQANSGFTDDRLGGEISIGFWPGLLP
jgi:hypothetical protein